MRHTVAEQHKRVTDVWMMVHDDVAKRGAHRLADEIDPVELRLLNGAEEGTKALYGPTFNRIGFKEVLQALREHPHYRAPLGPNQGRGVAAGFWFNGGMISSATVIVNEDGTVNVVEGNPDIGGSRASMALMAAEADAVGGHLGDAMVASCS